MVLRLLGVCIVFINLLACGPMMAMKTPMLATKEKVAQVLISKQEEEFPNILKELKENKAKTSDWIWWVFPSEQPGKSEPGEKTIVDLSSVDYLLSNANLDVWSEILEEIYALLIAQSNIIPNQNIIPKRDHGRIAFSLKFWLVDARAKTQQYPRFFNALSQLNRFFKWRS